MFKCLPFVCKSSAHWNWFLCEMRIGIYILTFFASFPWYPLVLVPFIIHPSSPQWPEISRAWICIINLEIWWGKSLYFIILPRECLSLILNHLRKDGGAVPYVINTRDSEHGQFVCETCSWGLHQVDETKNMYLRGPLFKVGILALGWTFRILLSLEFLRQMSHVSVRVYSRTRKLSSFAL